jgi:hypothetical protein
MEPDCWEQVERLYHSALERGPDARERFLDEACAGDEDLRREVAGLLACDVPSDSFIQSPAIEIAARAMAAEPGASPTSALMKRLSKRGFAEHPMIKFRQLAESSPLCSGGNYDGRRYPHL